MDHVFAMRLNNTLFITNLLHFGKCLSNRLSNDPVSFHCDMPSVITETLSEFLRVRDCLKPKSQESRFKGCNCALIGRVRKLRDPSAP
jgi:hypothetical protein